MFLKNIEEEEVLTKREEKIDGIKKYREKESWKKQKKNKWGLKKKTEKYKTEMIEIQKLRKKKQKIKQKAFSICWKLNLEMKYFWTLAFFFWIASIVQMWTEFRRGRLKFSMTSECDGKSVSVSESWEATEEIDILELLLVW